MPEEQININKQVSTNFNNMMISKKDPHYITSILPFVHLSSHIQTLNQSITQSFQQPNSAILTTLISCFVRNHCCPIDLSSLVLYLLSASINWCITPFDAALSQPLLTLLLLICCFWSTFCLFVMEHSPVVLMSHSELLFTPEKVNPLHSSWQSKSCISS